MTCTSVLEPVDGGETAWVHSLERCAANKSDLSEQRAVTEEEGREASEAHNCAHYAETSAKTSEGIEGTFLLLLLLLSVFLMQATPIAMLACFCMQSHDLKLL